MVYQNVEQIDRNLRNHVFDDVICKPPNEGRRLKLSGEDNQNAYHGQDQSSSRPPRH